MSIMAAGNECTATLAAAFQSWAYGGFTPAGGIFATLTSMGMLGLLVPIQVAFSAVLATLVTVVVWACGAGRWERVYVVPAYGEARQVDTGILCKRSEVKSETSCLWSRHEDLFIKRAHPNYPG